jgi:hypothetical protein
MHFPGLYPQPSRELRGIERVGTVAIIKQQIESMYIYEVLLQKMQAGNHLQQDVDFRV